MNMPCHDRRESPGPRAVCAALAFLFALAAVSAGANVPLYEEDPYDQITLNSLYNNQVLKVKPLPTALRRSILAGRNPVKLTVRRVEDQDKEYELLWRNVAKIEFFDQLVLNKASALVRDGKYEEAYDYFSYLQLNKPTTPGLAEACEDFLFAEANASYHNGQYDSALALLREIYRRNPKRPKLDRTLAGTTDKLIEQHESHGNYAAARALLRGLAAEYPDDPTVAKWTGRWHAKAVALLNEARVAQDAGQWPRTAELSRQLTAVCPELPGARELAEAVHRNYSRAVVGVTSAAAQISIDRLDDWASRRTRRLVYRTLAELTAPSTEGGKYDCPLGEITLQPANHRLTVRIKPDVHWAAGNATLMGADLARLLLMAAAPSSPSYRIDWSDLMQSVAVRGLYDVEVQLRRGHVHPEAMLQLIVPPPGAAASSDGAPLGNGPFVDPAPSSRNRLFVANPQYFANEPGRPMELVERRFGNTAQAVVALKRGDVQVVDRLNPWTLPALRADAQLKVQPYAMPLVHCLVPNGRRPLVADRNFRRALVYGINRQAILQQMLAGVEVPGCVVTSSPFPLGIGVGDPMGYASDETIEPRPYDPRLCIALANMAYQKYLDAEGAKATRPTEATPEAITEANAADKTDPKPEAKKRSKKRKLPPLPKLTLAYPSDEIARAACLAIQKQLDTLGVSVTLRALESPLPRHVPDDVDLLYVELAVWEPVVDAGRLFGEGGVIADSGPYMALALRQLDQASEWDQVRDCLHRVHRIAFDDVTVIPLWQLVEHFGYRRSLRGVAPRPVSLYQNVEQWRPAFQYPVEK
ncbi:MAG: ABC transporter substrate-binding protein [Thermoguttaceae bacterium]